MNGEAFVLDSNFILDYLKGSPAHLAFMREHVDGSLWASVITEMELYSFHALTESEKNLLDSFMSFVQIAPLDNQTKEIAIAFRRATRCKLPDSIIAASVIVLKASLVTSDLKLIKVKFPGYKVEAISC